MITAISAGSPNTVRSDSSPSTTSHPSPAAGVRAELRHGRPDQPGRIAARSRAARRRSSPRSFPCRGCRDHDRRREPRRARAGTPPRRRPGTRRIGRRDHASQPSGTTGSGASSISTSRQRLEVRRLDPVPATDLRPPRPCELRVGARAPRRRSRRTRAAAVKRGQARSAPRRSPRPRSAGQRAASPRPSARAAAQSRGSERTRSGTSARSRSRIMIAPPAWTKYSAFFA